MIVLITFTRFTGNGIFPGTGTNIISVNTGINGIAEALYRASNLTSFINDRIQVSFSGVLDTLELPLTTSAVSYYDFTPTGPQTTTAGVGVAYTVTARDLYGNAVINNDNLELSASGSGTAVFNPVSPISFNNTSTVNFTVTDNTAGSFSVLGVKQGAPGVTGQSGLITVNPAAAENLIYVSGNSNTVVAGNDQLLRVRVADQYSNNLNNDSIRFICASGTGNYKWGSG